MSWKLIEGAQGIYFISDQGQVRSITRVVKSHDGRAWTIPGRIHAGGTSQWGYRHVLLRIGNKSCTFRLHRLVAAAFIPNPENKPHVNHIDGDKNNNRAANLEWVTHSENVLHAYRTGLMTRKLGTDSPRAKLTEQKVISIRSDKRHWKEVAKEHGVSKATVQNVLARRTWGWVA